MLVLPAAGPLVTHSAEAQRASEGAVDGIAPASHPHIVPAVGPPASPPNPGGNPNGIVTPPLPNRSVSFSTEYNPVLPVTEVEVPTNGDQPPLPPRSWQSLTNASSKHSSTTSGTGHTTGSATPSGNSNSIQYGGTKGRLTRLWNLFGSEIVAVCIAVAECLLLVWASLAVDVAESLPARIRSRQQVYRTAYFTRAGAEFLALATAVPMGKYRRVGSTPLALEWQPSSMVDTFILSIVVFGTAITITIKAAIEGVYGSQASNIGYNFGVWVPGCYSIFLMIWVWLNRVKLQENGRQTIAFTSYARGLAMLWELYGAYIDIVYLSLAPNASSALVLVLELVRTVWETAQEIRSLKVSYAFNKLYIPINAKSLLVSLNTKRAEALKSNLELDGVVLVSGYLSSSEQLIHDIMEIRDALDVGPITGAYWYEALGGRPRPARMRAWLAVQSLVDSELAWADQDEVTMVFPELGVRLSTRSSTNGLCGYSSRQRDPNLDGRITQVSIWNERDPNLPSTPILMDDSPAPPPVGDGQFNGALLPNQGTVPQGQPNASTANTFSGSLNGATNSTYGALLPNQGTVPQGQPNASTANTFSGSLNGATNSTSSTHGEANAGGSLGGNPNASCPPSLGPLNTTNTGAPSSSTRPTTGPLVTTGLTVMDRLQILEDIFGLGGLAADAALDYVASALTGDRSVSQKKDIKTRLADMEHEIGMSGKGSLMERLELLEQYVTQLSKLEESLGVTSEEGTTLVKRIAILEEMLGFSSNPFDSIGSRMGRLEAETGILEKQTSRLSKLEDSLGVSPDSASKVEERIVALEEMLGIARNGSDSLESRLDRLEGETGTYFNC